MPRLQVYLPLVTEPTARRAAELRRQARRGSAVDAIVVTLAVTFGTLTWV